MKSLEIYSLLDWTQTCMAFHSANPHNIKPQNSLTAQMKRLRRQMEKEWTPKKTQKAQMTSEEIQNCHKLMFMSLVSCLSYRTCIITLTAQMEILTMLICKSMHIMNSCCLQQCFFQRFPPQPYLAYIIFRVLTGSPVWPSKGNQTVLSLQNLSEKQHKHAKIEYVLGNRNVPSQSWKSNVIS